MAQTRTITQDELDNFQVDEWNRLYWRQKPVLLEQRVSLGWMINTAVIVGGFSTLVLAVLGLLQFVGY